MPRRRLLILTLTCSLALALAVAPWTVTSGTVGAAIARQIRAVYGLDFLVRGRTTIALLPAPRLKFENVALSSGIGPSLIESAQLRGELRLLPMLIGRFELAEVSLNEARIRLDIDADGHSRWDQVLAHQRDRIAGRRNARQVRRLVITNSTLALSDGRRSLATELTEVSLVGNWPAVEGPLDLIASTRWRGEPVQISLSGLRPAALLAGAKNRVEVEATSALVHLALTLEPSFGEALSATGRANLTTRSVRDLVRWSGVDLPFASLVQNAGLAGDFTLERGTVSWPAVQLTIGSDRLDGALSARLDGWRIALAGTLAADRLNLTEVPSPPGAIRTPAGSSSGETLKLSALSGADLDLRLSASNARIGGLRVDDLAANVLLKGGRLEVSIGRATVNRGLVKGRAIVAQTGEAHDVKLQASFEQLDLSGLSVDLGQSRWISGLAQGQVVLDSIGETPADLIRQMQGRAGITVRQGELWGIALNEAVRRAERRPLSTMLDWKGGRTSFEQVQIVANMHGGVGEIVEGHVMAPPTRAALQGRVFLADRALAMKALVEPADTASGISPGAAVAFDISGPWTDISVVPDVPGLIQRSRAARPLLAPEPRGEEPDEPRTAAKPNSN
jgi:AsmA protein